MCSFQNGKLKKEHFQRHHLCSPALASDSVCQSLPRSCLFHVREDRWTSDKAGFGSGKSL